MEVLGFYAGDRQKPADARPSYADAAARIKTAPQRPVDGKKLPSGSERTIYDLGRRAESYDYRNDASEYRSEAVEDNGRPARKIAYQHQGEIAYVGAGLYFGGLDCQGYTAFKLSLRAEKPCKLEVKAYHSDKAAYRAVFPVGDQWQELVIPFDQLRGSDGHFDATRRLLKVELQPSRDSRGSSLLLGEFKLAVP
jgi:hypothetical protein